MKNLIIGIELIFTSFMISCILTYIVNYLFYGKKMNRSDEFFNLTVNLEGGFSNRIADRGGKTKYGITQKTLNEYELKHNLSSLPVEELSVDQAKDIYIEFYYLTIKPCVDAEIHFNFIDISYNSGYKHYLEIKTDIGNSPTIEDVYNWRTRYFEGLNQPENIHGWLNRLTTIKNYFNNGSIS